VGNSATTYIAPIAFPFTLFNNLEITNQTMTNARQLEIKEIKSADIQEPHRPTITFEAAENGPKIISSKVFRVIP
jgi:hypothetical protein